MAEALAIVGIVASIVQLVDFGSKVLHRLDEFQSSAGEIPKTFQHVKAELPVLLDTLEQTKTAIETGSIRDETKRALLPAIDGCRTQIESLDVLIKNVLPQAGDSWRERTRKSLSSLRQDAKVRKIRTDLQSYIQTLTYYHAAASSTLRPLTVPPLLRTPSSTVPFRRDRDFVDCDILPEIHQRFSQPASRAALVGLGGVGKSQLAIEYSYQVREKSPSTWVFWVHAGTAARFEEGYRRIAEKVKIPGWEKPEIDVLQLVSNWLCDEANCQWVIIVDNADDPAVFFQPEGSTDQNSVQVGRSLSDFLPQSLNGSILVTSRNRDLAYRLVGSVQDIIKVKQMDQEHALVLLHKKLPESLDQTDGTELVQALDYMPLAITQAAAYISQKAPRITVSKYLLDLRGNDEHKAALLKKDVGDIRRDGGASNSIIATWRISFEHIRKEWPSAARLLSLMSLFDRQGIPENLLRQNYQEDSEIEADFEDDISTLTSYSLITINPEGNEFEMHRLVQFSTKKWLELYNELEHWKQRYIEIMDEAFPVGRYENWTTCQQLFPHAEMVLKYWPINEDFLAQWASILFNAAWYSYEKGSYYIAEEMNRRALEGYKKALGEEHPKTLTSMGNLASTYWNQGRWKEAEELEVQVTGTKKRVLGEEHPDTLISMGNLASTYQNQGRWKEAEELEVQVTETRKRVLGEEHPDTLISMANLASTYQNQGRWKEAEDLGVQVTETRKRVLGEEHPNTLMSIGNLASTYQSQGRWKEAEDLGAQVIKTRKRVLGEEHPDTLISMANLASTYQNQGRWKEAEDLGVQVTETRKRVLGEEHPNTLMSIGNLASTYQSQGRWKEAEDLGAQVIKTRKRVLGEEHPDTLISMGNLALTYQNQGRWKEAEELEVQVTETRKRVLGEEHPDTLISMGNLALTYQNQGRWKEAEELGVQVIETRKRVLGEEHPDTLASMGNLALTYHNQGRWKEAEELGVQVIETRKRVLGEEHPNTLASISNLASTYRSQGRLKEAEELGVQVTETRKRVLGKEHPDTLTSMANLAFTWKGLGKTTDALEAMEECVQLQTCILGTNHPDTLASCTTLLEWQAENLEISGSAEENPVRDSIAS